MNDYLSRYNKAKDKCLYISKTIQESLTLGFNLNVQIFVNSADNDFVPTMTKQEFRKLSKIISSEITANLEHLEIENKYYNFDIQDRKLRNKIGGFNLLRIPEGGYSNYFGNENVYVDLGYDNISFSKEDICKEATRIFKEKNMGKSEILLIWSDRKELMGKDSEIIKELNKALNSSSFENIYFMTFFNKQMIKPDVWVNRIK